MPRKAANSATSRTDQEHFGGRRRAPRLCCSLPVDCAGGNGKYAARTVEISRSGALLEMRDPAFVESGSEASLLAFSLRVVDEFSGGMRILFAEPRLSLAARIIRATRHPSAASLLIGCEFLAALTDEQCRMLGLSTEGSPDLGTACAAQ